MPEINTEAIEQKNIEPQSDGSKFGESLKEDGAGKEFAQSLKESDYPSTYKERIEQTPKGDEGRGEWTGERGESKYVPTDEERKEILAEYGVDGIEYRDGIPDFSEIAEATVEIENMSEHRHTTPDGQPGNFEQADQKCAEQWNKEGKDGKTDWTARDVANWRRENGYCWHERNDMKTCDLVTNKHHYFGHFGGVGECKRVKAKESGFDE